MSIEKTIIAIPARLESTRLPNKILADINGKPMIQRVLEQCSKAKISSKIVICTDSKEVGFLVNKLGYDFINTKKSCASGSERIASALDSILKIAWGNNDSLNSSFEANIEDKLSKTGIINVQGDQPLLDPKVITIMDQFIKTKSENIEVVTPIHKINKEDIHNPAVVKTLVSNKGQALYFSRSAIPHIRDIDKGEWHKYYNYWGHVGIYGYRGDILNKWNKYRSSDLEKLEKLEQLRLIEAGIKISTFEVEGNFISVDTMEQLNIVRRKIT